MIDGQEISEIKLSDLERTKRIDAEFYKKENLEVDRILANWEKGAFTDFFFVSDGNHMAISDSFTEDEKGVPYYRGQDIYNLFIEQSKPLKIDENTYQLPYMRRSHIKQRDILMSIVGAIIGNTAMVSTNQEATCSCKLSILRAKNETVLPEVLLVFIKTRYGQNQIQKYKRGAAQTGLLLEDFNQLFIPKFSAEFQGKIKELVDTISYINTVFNEKYAEAENYLLSLLGMDGYSPSKDSITEKMLSESYRFSGRIDAEYYQPKFDELFYNLRKFTTKKLGEIVTFKKSIEPGSNAYGDVGIPFVRVSDLSANGILEPEIRVPENLIEDISALYPKKDTILFSKDGSVGIAYKVEKDLEIVTSSALLHLSIKNKKEVLPDYLTLLLNSIVVKMQAERDSNGAIIQHWNKKEIENVIIPMLDIQSQKQISQLVAKSFELRTMSGDLLNIARWSVEKAIEFNEDVAISFLNENTKGVSISAKL